jgi:hypothetical protein
LISKNYAVSAIYIVTERVAIWNLQSLKCMPKFVCIIKSDSYIKRLPLRVTTACLWCYTMYIDELEMHLLVTVVISFHFSRITISCSLI